MIHDRHVEVQEDVPIRLMINASLQEILLNYPDCLGSIMRFVWCRKSNLFEHSLHDRYVEAFIVDYQTFGTTARISLLSYFEVFFFLYLDDRRIILWLIDSLAGQWKETHFDLLKIHDASSL
jgi:hypothetical protein